MHAHELRAARLAVNSPEQRRALLCACQRVLESAEHANCEAVGDRGFDPRARERQLAEATALEGQLGEGRSTVAVGLGISGMVGRSLAELIEAEMHERAHGAEEVGAGTQVKRAAALMWTLVGLEAEIAREIMPACAAEVERTCAGIEPARA